MSDLPNPLNAFDFFNVSERDTVLSIIRDQFFADYGIVDAVHGNTSVDVTHAVLSVTRPGVVAPAIALPAIVTKNVELLFPVMGGLSISGTVRQGDGVLLVGLRDLVPSTSGLSQPARPPEFWHYTQQTLKAIPLSAVKAASVQFGEQGGKAFLRNQTQSLYTLLDGLEDALQTFMGPTSQASITAGGTSPAALASAIVALMATFTATTAQMRANLAALLEA